MKKLSIGNCEIFAKIMIFSARFICFVPYLLDECLHQHFGRHRKTFDKSALTFNRKQFFVTIGKAL